MKKIPKKGCVHIYMGYGKGKTTTALGLALRASLRRLKVCVFQFLKKKGSSAENTIAMPRLRVVCFDETHPMFCGIPKKVLRRTILKDLKKAERAIKSRRYDVIVLDEILNCVSERFVEEKDVLSVIRSKPECVELVLTGRGASKRLLRSADYVTRLTKVKHPFDDGLLARKGIEY